MKKRKQLSIYLKIKYLALHLAMLSGALTAHGQSSPFPPQFHHTKPDTITRVEQLSPVFLKIWESRRPVRIVMIGDSHVRGMVFPNQVRKELEDVWGKYNYNLPWRVDSSSHGKIRKGVIFQSIGINGATCQHFSSELQIEKIAELEPDLLILSFGTNEAHATNYTEAWHEKLLDRLVGRLTTRCPHSVILLTTPPGSSIAVRRTRKGNTRSVQLTSYVPNENTQRVTRMLMEYARDKNLPAWNLYSIVGGDAFACRNWRAAGMQRPDHIHYTEAGYKLQGHLLATAIISAYYNYVRTIFLF